MPTREPLTVALTVGAIVLVLISLAGPWWVVSSTSTSHVGAFNGTTAFTPFAPIATVVSTGYTTVIQENASGYYAGLPTAGAVFLVTIALAAVSAVSGTLVALAQLWPGSPSVLRKRPFVLAFVASGAAFVAALVVMLSLPGAVNQDLAAIPVSPRYTGFWGTTSTSGYGMTATLTYAAGWAWYAALFAAIAFFAGAERLRRAARPAPALGGGPVAPSPR